MKKQGIKSCEFVNERFAFKDEKTDVLAAGHLLIDEHNNKKYVGKLIGYSNVIDFEVDDLKKLKTLLLTNFANEKKLIEPFVDIPAFP